MERRRSLAGHCNVLLPVTDRGLRARVVPAVALDYSFGS